MNHIEHNITNFVYNFMPHGHCYLWNSDILWMQIISNSVIAIAYFLIPFSLLHFVRKRTDVDFKWVFILFGVFIISCGFTHIMDIIVIWHPLYWLDSLIRLITAMASIGTALMLIPLIPKAIALPSPTQLRKEIEERKKAEKDLKEVYEQLELKVKERTSELTEVNQKLLLKTAELEKSNQELQAFSYINSHDLQEPLRSITSFSQLLEKKYSDKISTEGNYYLNSIVTSSIRMKAQINDFLSYTNISSSSLKYSSINLNNLVSIVLEELNTDIQESKTKVNYENLPTIEADYNLIIQLFKYLIENSIKFKSSQNPIINISASHHYDNEWIFKVSDNGIGIEPEYFEKVFIIFQRLH